MALEPLFNDIAAAIHEKDGKADGIVAEDFPARIRAIPDHRVSAPLKDVNFFDYDGTLVYSYTLAEAQKLTALPDGPVHDGLVFQGWNWSLEKVKALTRPMNVGAMYITDDGKTRLKIRIWDLARSNVPLCISQTVANGVTIDWGDGSAPETLDGTGNVNTTHQYAATGDYTISLAVADGCTLKLGHETVSVSVLGPTNVSVYSNLLQEVQIGNGVPSTCVNPFRNCYSLKWITIPDSVNSVPFSLCYNCYSLRCIFFPDSITISDKHLLNGCRSLTIVSVPDVVTSLDDYSFNECRSLPKITIPDSVSKIGSYSFRQCDSLASITIPENVTSIGNNAFQGCSGMAEYHLKPATPPTLVDVNAFEGIPADCIIYVPAGSLEAYKTAENWSIYADHMREEKGGPNVSQI